MFKIKLSPITQRKLERFYSMKRGLYSLYLLVFLIFLSCFSELLINSRALIVKYDGSYFFPTYDKTLGGEVFGENYTYEADYKKLQKKFKSENNGNWVLMPPIPYDPFENDFKKNTYPPMPPSLKDKHLLGTDKTGRDILARLFYGFRIALISSIFYLFFTYLIGITIGCAMGFFGGFFDLLVQRFIEIWSNIPFIYLVIIVTSIIKPNLTILLGIIILFSWTSMTYYMRTSTYKEKTRDYISAAKIMGAGPLRIIFKHIMPNTLANLITYAPFSVASAITILTALDFLGFGLPEPTPSWGELLQQGTQNLDSPWIVGSTFLAMVLVLTLISFIGEAFREVSDPKKYSYYE